jgi:hypothetical protein
MKNFNKIMPYIAPVALILVLIIIVYEMYHTAQIESVLDEEEGHNPHGGPRPDEGTNLGDNDAELATDGSRVNLDRGQELN